MDAMPFVTDAIFSVPSVQQFLSDLQLDPIPFVEKLRKFVPSRKISAFIVEATEEKLRREQTQRAIKEILPGPPSFTEIEDSAAYVREL